MTPLDLVKIIILLASGAANASYISLESCNFMIPPDYYVSSGSIRGTEIKLVPLDENDLGSIRIKLSSGDPEEIEGEDFSVEIARSTEFSSHVVYELEHRFPGGDGPVASTVVMVGRYSIQITSQLRDDWERYLVNCSE